MMNARVSHVDGLPVLHLIDEAPFDLRTVLKRTLDISFSLAALSPPPIAAAARHRGRGEAVFRPGPILYRQTRMGLNGQTFEILEVPIDAPGCGSRQRTGVVAAGREPGDARRRVFAPHQPRRAAAVLERAAGRHVGGGTTPGASQL